MAEFYQLDIGYQVRILSGKYIGRAGFVVMGSRFGDVGINLHATPQLGDYQTRERPSELEIISADDPHKLQKAYAGDNPFFWTRMFMELLQPEIVVANPTYFTGDQLHSAEQRIQRKRITE